MNIDPKHLPGMGLTGFNEKEEEALPAKARIKENSRVLVFDEVGRDPDIYSFNPSLQKVTNLEDIRGKTLSAVVRYLKTSGLVKENLWIDDGGHSGSQLFHIVKNGGYDHDLASLSSPLKRYLEKGKGDNSLYLYLSKPRTARHRQVALSFIADMEFLGQKVGKKICGNIKTD